MTENPSKNITKNRADLSQFLIHLTKNGSFRIYEPFNKNPGHYLFKGGDTVEAKDSLIKIIQQGRLLARSPFGHFQFEIPVGYNSKSMMPLEWLMSVCFSEAPLSELSSFYESTQIESKNVNKYQKYGLAFSQSFVRSKGGHPVFYFDSNNEPVVEAVNKIGQPINRNQTRSILPLFESFGKKLHSHTSGSTDYRWEREWRFVGDFVFGLSEVAFGICPENDIGNMEQIAQNQFPFIDPSWDPEKIKEVLSRKKATQLLEAF